MAIAPHPEHTHLIRNDGVLPSPSEMTAYLDRTVYGQTQAKRSLATAVYNHYIGLAQRESGECQGPDPHHILFLGPTGTGKSFIVKTLARGLGFPFHFASATSLVQTGYVGTPVAEMVRQLVEAQGGDVERAQRGVIFIDEFDKVRRHVGEGGGRCRRRGGPDRSAHPSRRCPHPPAAASWRIVGLVRHHRHIAHPVRLWGRFRRPGGGGAASTRPRHGGPRPAVDHRAIPR